MSPKGIFYFSPARIIFVSILSTIIIGTFLLLLPAARYVPIPFIDLLFTATSGTCVTGLLTVPVSSFTPFGQCILLILIQLGGLGLITLTIFTLSLFTKIGFSTQLLAGQTLELESWKNIKSLLIFIIKFTLFFELVGACIVFFTIQHEFSLIQSIFLSLFHAVSSFCNAGFSLFHESMTQFSTNKTMLTITALLMLSGGLGFITWHELIEYGSALIHHRRRTLTLYSKIVLITTAILIAITATLYWILERNNTFYFMSPSLVLFNSIFSAIAVRSTGFTTMYPTDLHVATLFLTMIVGFIGSSPGSTGSGIKTTTFAIFLATIRSAIIGNLSVQIFGRRIAKDQIYKALTVIAISLAWIIFTTFCLLITETSWQFFDIFFEVVSAFATLGISTGITPHLSSIGKLFIIATMITGRIGALTLVLALKKRQALAQEYEYPEERIILG